MRKFSPTEISELKTLGGSTLLGKGATGEVFLGAKLIPTYDGGYRVRNYAIKKLSLDIVCNATLVTKKNSIVKQSIDQLERDVEREINLLSRVKHLNIVKLFGYSSENLNRGAPVIHLVYEYGSRGDLHDFLARKESAELLIWPIRQKIVYQLFCAVEFLHSNGYIHHDIKSGNIVLTDNFTPKLIDFGMTIKAMESKERERGASFQMGSMRQRFGTQGYICPAYNSGTVLQFDAFCEMFSLGVVCAELYTGLLQLSEVEENEEEKQEATPLFPHQNNIWGEDDDDGTERDADALRLRVAIIQAQIRRVQLDRDLTNYPPDPRIHHPLSTLDNTIIRQIQFVAQHLMKDYSARVRDKSTATRILTSLRKQMDPFSLPNRIPAATTAAKILLCTNCQLRYPAEDYGAVGLSCAVGHFLCKFCVSLLVKCAQSPESLLFNEVYYSSPGLYCCPYCEIFNDIPTNTFDQADTKRLLGDNYLPNAYPHPDLPPVRLPLVDNNTDTESNAVLADTGSALFMQTMHMWKYDVQDILHATLCANAIYESHPMAYLNILSAREASSQFPWKLWMHQIRKDGDHCCFGVFQPLKQDKLFIVFRGTEDMQDHHANVQFLLSTTDISPGKVHSGFWKKACKFYDTFHQQISHLVDMLSIQEIIFCGHSLGGAIAKLAAVKVHHEWKIANHPLPHHRRVALHCFAFAPPLVGDREFANYVNELTTLSILSLVNEADFIPRLLSKVPFLSYYPFGRYVFIRPLPEPILAFAAVSQEPILAILIGLKAKTWQEGQTHHSMHRFFEWVSLPILPSSGKQLEELERQYSLLDTLTPKPQLLPGSIESLVAMFSIDHGTLGVLPVTLSTDFVALSTMALLGCDECPTNPVHYLNAFCLENDLLCRFVEQTPYKNNTEESVAALFASMRADWKITVFHPVAQETIMIVTIQHDEILWKRFVGSYSRWIKLPGGGHVNTVVYSTAQAIAQAVEERLFPSGGDILVGTIVLTGFSLSGSVAQLVGYLLALDHPEVTVKVVNYGGPFVANEEFQAQFAQVHNLFYHSFYFNALPQPSFFSYHYLRAGVYVPLVGNGGIISFVFPNQKVLTTELSTAEDRHLVYRLFYHASVSQNNPLDTMTTTVTSSSSPPVGFTTTILEEPMIPQYIHKEFALLFKQYFFFSATKLAALRTSSSQQETLTSLCHMLLPSPEKLSSCAMETSSDLPAYHPGCFQSCFVPGLAIPDQYADGMPHPLWHCCFRRSKEGCKQGMPRHHPGFYGLADPHQTYSYQGFRDVLTDVMPEWSCCRGKQPSTDGCQPGPHPELITTWTKKKFSSEAIAVTLKITEKMFREFN